MTVTFHFESSPKQEDTQKLLVGILENANIQRGLAPGENFAFFLKDENNEIKGGCSGCIYYGCIYVDLLWVDAALRNQDHGSTLMNMAEKLARAKHCSFFAVNTMDFEALEFYKKLGFTVEFERSGFAKECRMYFLRKNLLG